MLSAISRPAAASARHQIRSSDNSNLLMTVSYRPGRIDALSAVFGVVQRTRRLRRTARDHAILQVETRGRHRGALAEKRSAVRARGADGRALLDRRALGNRTLNTDEYEYISFTPSALAGLPQSASVGQPFTFQVTGDLTIKDVTKSATFEVAVTPSVDGALAGTATTTINYADWDVSIPSVWTSTRLVWASARTRW